MVKAAGRYILGNLAPYRKMINLRTAFVRNAVRFGQQQCPKCLILNDEDPLKHPRAKLAECRPHARKPGVHPGRSTLQW